MKPRVRAEPEPRRRMRAKGPQPGTATASAVPIEEPDPVLPVEEAKDEVPMEGLNDEGDLYTKAARAGFSIFRGKDDSAAAKEPSTAGGSAAESSSDSSDSSAEEPDDAPQLAKRRQFLGTWSHTEVPELRAPKDLSQEDIGKVLCASVKHAFRAGKTFLRARMRC